MPSQMEVKNVVHPKHRRATAYAVDYVVLS